MSYFDEARAISSIINMRKLTQGEIAKSMGVSQSYIANKLRLLKFSPAIENIIIERGLSERHARSLLRLKSDKDVCIAVDKISAMHLNVSESEVLIDTMLPKKEIRPDYSLLSVDEIKENLEKFISDSISAIKRLGFSASKTKSYYNEKEYITICLE